MINRDQTIKEILKYLSQFIHFKFVLVNGQWQKYTFDERGQLKNYQQILQSFYISKNKTPLLLVQVFQFQFKNLKDLNLKQNLIQTIQPFQNSQFPLLEELNLSQNHITSLKPLRRANIPSISTIYLHLNPIYQTIFSLDQLQAPKLRILSFEYFSYHYPNKHDITTFVKLQTTSLQALFCESIKRIYIRLAIECLKRRFLSDHNILQQYLITLEQGDQHHRTRAQQFIQ